MASGFGFKLFITITLTFHKYPNTLQQYAYYKIQYLNNIIFNYING